MKTTLRFLLAVLVGLVLVLSCNKFEYSGEEYLPTDSVAVFGEDDSIPKPYTVIGHLSGTKGRFNSMEGLRREMVREAAKRGADAIAFMAETDWESEGEKQYAGGVAGPMESGLGLSRREKGIWALLIKFE